MAAGINFATQEGQSFYAAEYVRYKNSIFGNIDLSKQWDLESELSPFIILEDEDDPKCQLEEYCQQNCKVKDQHRDANDLALVFTSGLREQKRTDHEIKTVEVQTEYGNSYQHCAFQDGPIDENLLSLGDEQTLLPRPVMCSVRTRESSPCNLDSKAVLEPVLKCNLGKFQLNHPTENPEIQGNLRIINESGKISKSHSEAPPEGRAKVKFVPAPEYNTNSHSCMLCTCIGKVLKIDQVY